MIADSSVIRVIESDIPAHWRRASISDLLKEGSLELVQDGNHGGNYPKATEFESTGIPLITGADLTAGVIDFRGCQFLNPSRASRLRVGFAEPGDVLLSHKGTMGKTAIVPHLDWPYIILNPQLTLYRVRENGSINRRYLKFFFDSAPFQKLIERISGISTISSLSLTVQKSLEIPLPPLPEQKAIARILGTLDDKIELNRRMNATLEAMARALFQSWFVDFDPVHAKAAGRQPSGMPPATAALFPATFQDSALGEIPEGWTAGKLSDIATNPRRSVQPSDIAPNTPYIALEHMPRRSIALGEWEPSAKVESGKTAFQKGQILFGKLRPYFHKVGVAPVSGVCSTDILVLASSSPDWFGILLGHASSDAVIQFADKHSTGTKMPRINWIDLSSFKIAIPPPVIAKAFNDQVQPLIGRIHANLHQSRTLATLRDTLLPKLLSGGIRVIPQSHASSS